MIPHRRSQIIGNRAVHHATALHHHYHRPRSRIILPPRAVIAAAGPVFAFVQPTSYAIETQAPESGLHVQADDDDMVAMGTEMLLVFVVIVIGGWTLILRHMPLEREAAG